MPDIFDKIKQMAGPTMRGLTSQLAPQITRGLLIEYLGKVKIADIIDYVEKDIPLWGKLDIANKNKAKKTIASLTQDHVEWFTSEWAIDAIRKELPRVASLFLGDVKARNWLDRQIVDIKQQLQSKDENGSRYISSR